MIRLLLCILAALALSLTLLMLRQQRLVLENECNALHDEMLAAQTRLWRQQTQIAAAVSPAALEAALARRAAEVAQPFPDAGTSQRASASEYDGGPVSNADATRDDWGVLTSVADR